jgi:hypothetical protein
MFIHDDSAEVPERITPAERPPYWSDCEIMTLPELGRFIYDALMRLTEPRVPDDGSTPLTRQEFSDLVGLMQAKAGELQEDTTMPVRPVYDGPPFPQPFPDTTGLLIAACKRRNEAQKGLADAIKYQAIRNLIYQRREEVRKAKQAIPLIEAEAESRKEDILQLRREYWEAREPYERSLSAWEREVAMARGRLQRNQNRQALVGRARSRVRQAFRPKQDLVLQP